MKQYVFGIDMGGTTIKIGLFQKTGTLIAEEKIPTRKEHAGENLLTDIAAAIFSIMEEHDLVPAFEPSVQENEEIEGVVLGAGLAVPGAVLNDREVKPCVNLDGWGREDVAGELGRLLQMPVCVLNDANAAALGELWQGSGRGCSSLIFVTLGTGIGGGLIMNGKLVNGAHGSAGEIGHIKLYGFSEEQEFSGQDDPGICGCGKKGCAEQYGSATGLVRLAMKYGYPEERPEEGASLDAEIIMNAAASGKSKAAELALKEFADELGRMLASVSCVVDPEAILLGGGVSKAGEQLLDLVRPAFRKYAFPAAEETPIRLSNLENQAGIFGAAKYFLDSQE